MLFRSILNHEQSKEAFLHDLRVLQSDGECARDDFFIEPFFKKGPIWHQNYMVLYTTLFARRVGVLRFDIFMVMITLLKTSIEKHKVEKINKKQNNYENANSTTHMH